MNSFNLLYEKEIERFQQGGFLIGARIQFKKNALSHDFVKNRAASFKEIIAACLDKSFDLNLRIGAIKSIYPTTTQNYSGGATDSPDGIFLDIYIEYAPGLYRNPMTVPIDIVEVFDDGNNRGPVPDSLRRKNKVHGPEKVQAKQPGDNQINLQNKNVVLPGANKWDDTAPGGGNF